ncbi:hypothetical protein GGI24_001730 [Coemansia furcata]|nr:hypothetical protein GGI24_001730 [Coemansia furcata]
MPASSKAISAKTSSTQSLQPRPGSSSDVDSEVQSNKPLFLNFTAELAPFGASNKKQKTKKSNVYKVSGVNILNRNSVDSKTALERLQRRRENHNFVERRRRDNINHTITTLSSLIPYCAEEGVKLNKGSILHMAVEYIRDMQDINSVLSAENIRLGGSGSMELPANRPNRRDSSVMSELNTAVHSEDDDDDDDDGDGDEQDDEDDSSLPLMMCSSTSTTSTQSPQTRSRKGSVSQATTPSRKRSNSKAALTVAEAGHSGAAGACKRPMLSVSSTITSSSSATPMSSRTNLSLSSAGHYHGHLPGGMGSPPLVTVNTSTAPSAHTSPMGTNSTLAGASFAYTNVRSVPSATNLPHLPPPLAAKPHQQQQLPPMMSSHSSMTINGASLVSRQPTQSMPNSPNFRPALLAVQPLMGVARNSSGSSASSINSHPFFNSDVSSVRHNLQPPSDVHPVYGSTTAPHSLQSTPMMRPDPTLSEKFELPPLAFNDGSTAPYLSRMP